MRFGILCSEDSWYFRDLRRAAGNDYQLTSLAFDRLLASVDDASNSVVSAEHQLSSFDAVLVRTMPPGSLEQVVFRMDVLGRLEAAGVTVVNRPRAVEAAVDKYLSLAKMRRAGLPVPRTFCCQTVADAMAGFEKLGGDAVIKPLFGSEGRGITRVSDEALALRAFKLLAQMGAVIYLQEFVPHEGFDVRVLLIGDETYAVRRSHRDDWRTNVSRGARCEAVNASASQRDMARTAATAVGATVAGVDILRARDGREYVLEVNAVPGWKALAVAHDVDIGRRVLDFVSRTVRTRQS